MPTVPDRMEKLVADNDALFATRVRAVVMPDARTYGVVGWDKAGREVGLAMTPTLAHDLILQLLRCACEAGGEASAPVHGPYGSVFALPCGQVHLLGSMQDEAVMVLGIGKATVPVSLPSSILRQTGTRLLQLADLQEGIAAPGPRQ